ncbi:MAG: DUF4288 domain-containing protein [Bacteroidota bacterium]
MWYIAELVEEFTVEGKADNVVHINGVLLQAESDDAAYKAALNMAWEDEYTNPQGQTVRVRFLGIQDLTRIHDDLEHGAELYYSERVGLTAQELAGLVSERSDLGVFRAPDSTPRPDYSDGQILREAMELVRASRRNPFDK